MKLINRYQTLSTKLLISMIVWVVCAILITGYALALLWQLENAGIAINHTGSLRMRIYHMVLLSNQNDKQEFLQQQQQFTKILNKLKQFDNNTLIFPNNKKINLQIKYIEETYHKTILPLVNQLGNNRQLSQTEHHYINQFVYNINCLVKLIEDQNTKDIIWLRFISAMIICMVIITAFSSIYLLYRSVITPLRQLETSIKSLSLGKLSERLPIINQNEFGVVSAGFNQMAQNLQDLYNTLEQKVAQKTKALKEKNRELTILYDMISFLHTCLTPSTATEKFLDKIIHLSEADAGFVGFLNKDKKSLNFICSKGFPKQYTTVEQCYFSANCFFDVTSFPQNAHPISIKANQNRKCSVPTCIKASFNHFTIFPIQHNKNEIGLMVLYFKNDETSLSRQTLHLIKTLSQQLAVSIENQQLTAKEKQLAVMEERNLIAQGLHDSIAQSLSFLNLQAQMLQKAIDKQDLKNMQQNLAFIQQGIQESYDDVRELLINFRTKICQDDFEAVVKKVIDRFTAQTKIPVTIHNLQKFPFLSQQQCLQIIFILQEALSNIRKHSQCKSARLTFSHSHNFTMTIKDDGIGFDIEKLKVKQQNHIGLAIIKERAEKISGMIKINSIPHQGTTLELTLPIQ